MSLGSFRLQALLVLAVLIVAASVYALQGDTDQTSASGGVISIGVGSRHTCVVTESRTVKCWGDNDQGQLGDGTTIDRSTPVDVCAAGAADGCAGGSLLTGVVAVSTGYRHTCVLTASGGAKCWGTNNKGQLGDGTMESHPNPADVCASGMGLNCEGGDPLSGVVEVEAGALFSCALLEDGGIKCWGNGDEGQLGAGLGVGDGTGLPVDVCAPTTAAASSDNADETAGAACVPITNFSSLTAGRAFACGLATGGGVQCWGRNLRGQLGMGTTDQQGNPVDVCAVDAFELVAQVGVSGVPCDPINDIVDVEAGTTHTCALTVSGRVACWGDNSSGTLGSGTGIPFHTVPLSVCASSFGATCEELSGIEAIASGNSHTCAISEAGGVMCWGSDLHGELGDGNTEDRANPIGVQGLDSGATLLGGGPGSRHNCAEGVGGLQCWGYNVKGQLGVGSSDDEPHPLPLFVSGLGSKGLPTATTPAPDTPTPTATPEPTGLIGDVDCGSSVNAIDAALLLQFIAGLIDGVPCPDNSDANEDGMVNSIDTALILQFTAGLLSSLPP